MSVRRQPVVHARQDLVAALEQYLREGLRLARCRARGGHELGTWRLNDGKPNPSGIVPTSQIANGVYPHTWCRQCGWCEQTQSFSEEDEWTRDPTGTQPAEIPF